MSIGAFNPLQQQMFVPSTNVPAPTVPTQGPAGPLFQPRQDLSNMGPRGDRAVVPTDLGGVPQQGNPFDFTTLDQNHDGVLSGTELQALPADLVRGLDVRHVGEITHGEFIDGAVRLGFQKLDGNGDGVLSGQELAGLDPAMRQALDADRNGELSYAEFAVGMKVAAAFAADKNGDGYLSGNEITPDLAKYAYKAADGRMVLSQDGLRQGLMRELSQPNGPRPANVGPNPPVPGPNLPPVPPPPPVPPVPPPPPVPVPPVPPYPPGPQPQPQPTPQPRPTHPVKVDASNFEQEVLKSDVPVLVDFYADWCGPCQQVLPILGRLAANPNTPYKIVEINVDRSSQLYRQYGGGGGIPSLRMFKGGQIVDQTVGAMGQSQLEAWANRAAGK